MKKISKILKFFIIVCLLFRCVYILNLAITSAISYPHGSFDFQWDAAKLLTDRINPYYESLFHNTAYDGKYEMFYDKVEANQFPSLLWILFPLTLLKPYTANIVWAVLNLLNLIIIFLIMRKTLFSDFSKFIWWLIVLLILCSSPLQACIGNGQHTIFAVSNFLIASLIMNESEKNRGGGIIKSGLFLALSYFKYTVTAPLIGYFIYRRWFKPILVSLIPHILLTVYSAWWLKSSIKDMLLLPMRVSSELENSGFIDLSTAIPSRSIYLVAVLIIVTIVIFIVVELPEKQDLLLMSLLVISGLMIVYHRRYDFWILCIPMGYILQDFAEGHLWNHKIKLFFGILCLLGIYFVFFDDTIIKKLGIHFVVGAEYSNIYLAICRSLIFLAWFVLMITCLKKIQQEKENKNQIL